MLSCTTINNIVFNSTYKHWIKQHGTSSMWYVNKSVCGYTIRPKVHWTSGHQTHVPFQYCYHDTGSTQDLPRLELRQNMFQNDNTLCTNLIHKDMVCWWGRTQVASIEPVAEWASPDSLIPNFYEWLSKNTFEAVPAAKKGGSSILIAIWKRMFNNNKWVWWSFAHVGLVVYYYHFRWSFVFLSKLDN